MKLKSKRRVTGRVLWTVAVVAVMLLFAFGGRIISGLTRAERRLCFTIGDRLLERHGVVFLAEFDEPSPCDAVSQLPMLYSGVPRVKGRFGNARKIDLEQRPVINMPISKFSGMASEVTFAAWFRPKSLIRRQSLLDYSRGGIGFNLTLEQDKLRLDCFNGATNLEASCGFVGKSGAYSHIAIVFSDTGASIWQNGTIAAEVPFSVPMAIPMRLNSLGSESHFPFEGDVDDMAIWNRALSAAELRSIASSSVGLKRKYEPFLACAVDVAHGSERFMAGLYRCVGRLAPPLFGPSLANHKIPSITVWPSHKDARHFLFAHEESIKSGFRTLKAAEFRTVDLSLGGRSIRAEISLDDMYGRSDAKRMAFIVKDPTRSIFGGCGMVRVYPPELYHVLHPDAMYALPLSASFVRLYHDDAFKGLYVIEPFDYSGGAWKAHGIHDPVHRTSLYFNSPMSPSDYPPDGISASKAFDAASSLVLTDTLFPWSRQEIKARQKDFVRRRKGEKFHPAPERDEVLMRISANNPSPMFVTNDLALNLPGITWESSDPSLVAPDGRVTRPMRGAPVPVILTPIESNGTRGVPRKVRIAPYAPDLQALFIYVGFPVEKHRRNDFVCYRVPAGGGAPEWITGIGGSNGGIKHRGNTSYIKGAKRSFSLEFDNKVTWPGSSREAQHVLLFSGYADPTRLRNKISFDSYRVAASPDIPCGAIDISWSEVFINGEYFGVWETCRRVKDICDPKTYLYKIRARNPDLWGTPVADMVECVSAYDPRSNPYRPLESLFAFTAYSSREEFAKSADDTFYLDSIIDYILMLNFTENFDGQITNQYIGRRKGDDKWFVIPWDYDKTFFDSTRSGLSNLLTRRFCDEVPGFKEMVAEKWKSLRTGPMSDKAVLRRIDADAAMLAPYMDEEYRLLQPAGWDGDFAAAVTNLKEVIVGRLKLMDSIYLPK